MPQATRRRFTLLDAMILVLAAVAGFEAAYRWEVRWDLYPDFMCATPHIASHIALLLAPFVPALILIRFLVPRPRCIRLCRQPGLQACLATCIAMLAWCLNTIDSWFFEAETLSDVYIDAMWILADDLPEVMGSSVALAWSAALLTGSRRREASWVDRSGRVLGWTFIILWLVNRWFSTTPYFDSY